MLLMVESPQTADAAAAGAVSPPGEFETIPHELP
jgi:hypothetical protein